MLDVIIIFIILLIAALIFKRFSNVIISFGLIDIFLRILNYIGNNTIKEVNEFINKIFPSSIASIISKHCDGTLESILMWGYVLLMSMFLYYVFRMLLKRL